MRNENLKTFASIVVCSVCYMYSETCLACTCFPFYSRSLKVQLELYKFYKVHALIYTNVNWKPILDNFLIVKSTYLNAIYI